MSRNRWAATTRLVAVLVAVAALAGCGGAPDAADPSGPATATATTAASAGAVLGASSVDLTPVRLQIPAIAVDTTDLIGLGRDAAGGWATPDVHNPGQASWYNEGPLPGADGPAVLLGHVNGSTHSSPGDTPGIFARLADLAPADQIIVTAASGTVTEFRVTARQEIPKDQFPTAAILADTPGAEIRLITCGGDVDHAAHRYLSSIIVYGVAVA